MVKFTLGVLGIPGIPKWMTSNSGFIGIALIALMAVLINSPMTAHALEGVCVAFCNEYVPPPSNNNNYNTGSGGYYSKPKGRGWFCEARASDGSWGWSESAGRDSAQNIALSQCGKHAGNCRITVCSQGAGKNYDHVKGRWLQKPSIQKRTSTKKEKFALSPRSTRKNKKVVKLSCSICYNKLKADVNTGWASARIRSHVQSSLSGYNNCKRKSDNQCNAGNRISQKLSTACLLKFADSDYRVCIADILQRY